MNDHNIDYLRDKVEGVKIRLDSLIDHAIVGTISEGELRSLEAYFGEVMSKARYLKEGGK